MGVLQTCHWQQQLLNPSPMAGIRLCTAHMSHGLKHCQHCGSGGGGWMGFPGGSDGKASAYNVGDPGSIPRLGRSPGEGNGNPLQYSYQENSMDRGAWYSPWGRKESDMTDCLTLSSGQTHSTFEVASRVPSTVSHFKTERGNSLEML